MSERLDDLLQKLQAGDREAAEEVFRVYEPYLRMTVRRMLPARLRRKFDSVDIVHSVWADLLGGFRTSAWQFPDTAHLRAFLVKAARNRFIDRMRKHHTAVERERSLPVEGLDGALAGADPRPSEIAQANVLWEQMLQKCLPQHRPVLLLKRQGCSLAEIAAKTGYHPSSVRRILYDLAKQVAFKP
jgi:RNA polymerase sigma-70 factor (ECF subfamily)